MNEQEAKTILRAQRITGPNWAESWLSLKEAVQALEPCFTESGLRLMAYKGTCPFRATKMGGRWFFRAEDIREYKEEMLSK